MKKAFLFLAFCGALVAAQAQTADEVVNKHITALGGKEKLATLKTLVREGALNYNGMDIPITLYSEQDKGFKMVIDVMGTKGYQILTPTEGWSFMPFQGQSSVEKMKEEELKKGQDDIDLQGELVDYAAKGHKVEFLGKEKQDGVEVYKLKLTPKVGVEKTMYIDVATNYLHKVSVTEKDQVSEVTYKDYKKTAEGFIIANTLVRPEGEVVFTKVTTNGTLPENVFKPE